MSFRAWSWNTWGPTRISGREEEIPQHRIGGVFRDALGGRPAVESHLEPQVVAAGGPVHERGEVPELPFVVAAVVVAQAGSHVHRQAQPAVLGGAVGQRGPQDLLDGHANASQYWFQYVEVASGCTSISSARVGSDPEPANFFVALISIVVLNRATSISMLSVAVPTHFPLPDS